MKKIVTLFAIVLFLFGKAQSSTVNYTASTSLFSNPERGFFKFTETHSNNYDLVSQPTLISYRTSENITLIYRSFFLENFINSPISEDYLNNMQTDFNRIRNSGLKVILRFAYSNNLNATPRDASKTQILEHIAQLQPLLVANADIIAVMQAGFIGTWGEWHYTSQSEFGGWGFNQTNLTNANITNRKAIATAILAVLPVRRMIQIRYPNLKQKICNELLPISSNIAFNESMVTRIGHHNDCFLSSNNDVGTYENIITEYPYLEQDSKYVPMGGESCAFFESRTNCTTALLELAKFHWSYMNKEYYPSVIQNFLSGGCFSEIEMKLGYRFELVQGVFPQSISNNGTFPITLTLKNVGFAAPFNPRDAYIVLKSFTTNLSYPIKMGTDPRTWLGPNNFNITEYLTLPENLPYGNYKLFLYLPDSDSTIANKPHYAIRFANNNMWESTTGYNNLNHTITVTDVLAISNNSKVNSNIYPVPAHNQMVVELDNVEAYTTSVYNSLGQMVTINTTISGRKLLVDTQSLSDGIYFITFENGITKESRKFTVSH